MPSNVGSWPYAAGAFITWFIGTSFLAGWHYATIGTVDIAGSAVQGLVFVVIAAAIAAIRTVSRAKALGVPQWVGVGLGVIFIEAAFFIGLLLGGIWSGYGGKYPNMTGLKQGPISMVVGSPIGRN